MLKDRIPGAIINGPEDTNVSYILNISIRG